MRGVHLLTIPNLGTDLRDYCDEYQAVFDAMTVKAPPKEGAVWNDNFVAPLVANGRWSRADVVWVLASHDSGEALLDWKNPTGTKATLHGAPAPTFTEDEGFTGQGNASGAYINFHWISSVHGVNYTLNSATMLAYARKAGAAYSNNECLVGVLDSIRLSIIPRSAGGNFSINVNSNAAHAVNTQTDGMFVASRQAANDLDGWLSKSQLIDSGTGSVSLPTKELYGLALNFNDAPNSETDNQLSLVVVSDGMNEADVISWTDCFNNAMKELNKNVF